MIVTSKAKHQNGFTLLEVLVALIILSIGLLGFAGVQALTISNIATARTRSVASELVVGLASAMEANHAYWGVGAASALTCINFDTSGTAVFQELSSGACPTTLVPSGSLSSLTPPNQCMNTFCTAPQIAAADLTEFGKAIRNSGLPGGNANIACSTAVGVPVTCTIKVFWKEKNVAINQPTGTETGDLASGKDGVDQSYSQIVQP